MLFSNWYFKIWSLKNEKYLHLLFFNQKVLNTERLQDGIWKISNFTFKNVSKKQIFLKFNLKFNLKT